MKRRSFLKGLGLLATPAVVLGKISSPSLEVKNDVIMDSIELSEDNELLIYRWNGVTWDPVKLVTLDNGEIEYIDKKVPELKHYNTDNLLIGDISKEPIDWNYVKEHWDEGRVHTYPDKKKV